MLSSYLGMRDELERQDFSFAEKRGLRRQLLEALNETESVVDEVCTYALKLVIQQHQHRLF